MGEWVCGVVAGCGAGCGVCVYLSVGPGAEPPAEFSFLEHFQALWEVPKGVSGFCAPRSSVG